MGKQQLIVGSVAKALEIIPRQICDNAGLDATDVLNKLRMRHAQGDLWAGVDVDAEGVSDNMKKFVWEPALVKTNALSSAIDAACLILSVDETVRNPQSEVSAMDRLQCVLNTDENVGSAGGTTHAKRSGTEGSARTRKGTWKIGTGVGRVAVYARSQICMRRYNMASFADWFCILTMYTGLRACFSG